MLSRPGTIGWFARHEARLAWRDWLSLMTAGRRRRTSTVVLGFTAYVLFMHGLAYLMLSNSAGRGETDLLAAITVTLVLTGSLMLSQALESATRVFYARGDLDLILTSPAAVRRLFAVRIAAMSVTIAFMTLVLTAPFIDVLVWRDGARWAGAYVVTLAMAMDAVAVAVVLTVAMFRAIGPKRTRVIAQVAAAVIGAGFAISMQLAAFSSYGSVPRFSALREALVRMLSDDDRNPLLWPARAVLGDVTMLVTVLGLSVAALIAVILMVAPRFGQLSLDTLRVSGSAARWRRKPSRFRNQTPMQSLRRKEWTLLLRDPWLMSQTLMQLLYLLPPGFLLWRDYYAGSGGSAILVPILIMTAGQLGGGLAWLAVSGEDAPDLIASAPVARARVVRAKTEAVLGGIAVIFAPFVVVLAAGAPFAALVVLVGIIVAAGSATAIQYWFRTQARRSIFRQRQTSSRVATFAEALSSIGWAGTGALAATGTWVAVVPGTLVLAMVAGVWMISPARAPSII
jgi:ABC-2 type transport system permease protein